MLKRDELCQSPEVIAGRGRPGLAVIFCSEGSAAAGSFGGVGKAIAGAIPTVSGDISVDSIILSSLKLM